MVAWALRGHAAARRARPADLSKVALPQGNKSRHRLLFRQRHKERIRAMVFFTHDEPEEDPARKQMGACLRQAYGLKDTAAPDDDRFARLLERLRERP